MNQSLTAIFASIALFASVAAMAKDPEIASNSSGVEDAKLINSIAAAAKGSGVTEPLNISGNSSQLVVTGSNGTRCEVPLIDGKMKKGIRCK